MMSCHHNFIVAVLEYLSLVREAARSSVLLGGADELGAVSMRAEVGGGEVASSSSSITLAFTVARRKNSQSLQ